MRGYFVFQGISWNESMRHANRAAAISGRVQHIHAHRFDDECNDRCRSVWPDPVLMRALGVAPTERSSNGAR